MTREYLDVNKYDTYDLWAHTERHLERNKLRFYSKPNFYPSEASVIYFDQYGDRIVEGTCLRQAFYRLKGVIPTPSDARAEITFAMGKAVEAFLIEQWKQMGVWVDNNVKFFTAEMGFPLSGELDAILAEPPDGKLYGIEIKSFAGYYATKAIMGNRSEDGGPKLNQLLQTLIYAFLFRQNLYCFRLTYLARDEPSQHRTFKVEVIQEDGVWYPKVDGEIIRSFTIGDIFDRYRKLQEYLDKDELPPRDYEIKYTDAKVQDLFNKGKLSKKKYEDHSKGKQCAGDWNCSYCNFKHLCYQKASL